MMGHVATSMRLGAPLAFSIIGLFAQLPIRVSTRLVEVNVIATDRRGQPVTGLSKGDFLVSDGSVPQKVIFFTAQPADDARAEAPGERWGNPTVIENTAELRFAARDPGSGAIGSMYILAGSLGR